ncbi:fructokinase [Scopulibacillus darangshiensis]|uniref:Fructokinase n=1 Tax=Scopulibacillus darangshiensis TaxID=442528 RepID=A0A4R2P590_9BACL|nr:PfkB family carbohydrate kinase [Scopulibacillus darangshiensis]TCP29847.1 fructokinase [Scopulibacillus darangshiensis]
MRDTILMKCGTVNVMDNNKCLTIGEAMVEFVPHDHQSVLKDTGTFDREAAGAPAIVAGVVSLLGKKSAMIGKIGNDVFGDYLIEKLSKCGVDTVHLGKVKNQTAISFTAVNGDKEQDIFYRQGSADTTLKPDDIDEAWFKNGDILYYASASLVQNPARGAVEKALKSAGKKGSIIVFAPRLSINDWPNEKMARETLFHTAPHAHILVLTEEELKFLADRQDEYEAVKMLFVGKTKLMVILRKDQTLTYVTGRERGHLNGPNEEPLDGRGMEEAFIGCLVTEFLNKEVRHETLSHILSDRQQLEDMLNAAIEFRTNVGNESGRLAAIETLQL